MKMTSLSSIFVSYLVLISAPLQIQSSIIPRKHSPVPVANMFNTILSLQRMIAKDEYEIENASDLFDELQIAVEALRGSVNVFDQVSNATLKYLQSIEMAQTELKMVIRDDIEIIMIVDGLPGYLLEVVNSISNSSSVPDGNLQSELTNIAKELSTFTMSSDKELSGNLTALISSIDDLANKLSSAPFVDPLDMTMMVGDINDVVYYGIKTEYSIIQIFSGFAFEDETFIEELEEAIEDIEESLYEGKYIKLTVNLLYGDMPRYFIPQVDVTYVITTI